MLKVIKPGQEPKYYQECDYCHAVFNFHDTDIYEYCGCTYVNCPYCEAKILLTVGKYPAKK